MRKNTGIMMIAGLFVMLCTAAAVGETSVIVHPENDARLSDTDVAEIFLGKRKRFSNGMPATPVNQTKGSIARKEFEEIQLKMSPVQLKLYWTEKLYAGLAFPPDEAGGDLAVMNIVAEDKTSIGYVDSRFVDETVHVLYTIQIFSGR